MEERRRIVVDPLTGEVVDEESGVVLQDRAIDTGPEWRAYSYDEWMSRARAARSTGSEGVHDHGLHTYIDRPGTSIAKRLRNKLASINERIRYEEVPRTLMLILKEVWRIGRAEALPQEVIGEAGRIARKLYRFAVEKNMVLRDAAAAAVACVVTAARMFGIPLSFKELSARHLADRKMVWRYLKMIHLDLGIRSNPIKPIDVVDKIAMAMGLPEGVALVARKIVVAAARKGVATDRNPVGLAAAAVYLAAKLLNIDVTQRMFEERGIVKSATLRNSLRELVENVWIEVGM